MRSGFVPVVGRPNVGKSTLVNALVGEKVAITSSRPQTTRNTIRGVLTRHAEGDSEGSQIVFVDTPGLHKPRTALGTRLNKLVYGSLAESDCVVFVVDATGPIGPGDRRIAERLREADAPTVVVVAKTDAAPPDAVVERLGVAGEWDFDAYVPVSSLEGDGLDAVVDEIISRLPEGGLFFPPDTRSDQPDVVFAAELVREKYLARLRDELPHSLAVVVGELAVRPDGTVYVAATAYVERSSQKDIVIGH
ncbi:MAG: GTPase Era, partial [Acidimicrobiia bacterium]